MQKTRDLIGKDDLGVVDLGALKRAEAFAFLNRKLGVKLQEPAHICIRRVPPELPELIRAEHVAIQPDRPPLTFTHFLAIRGG